MRKNFYFSGAFGEDYGPRVREGIDFSSRLPVILCHAYAGKDVFHDGQEAIPEEVRRRLRTQKEDIAELLWDLKESQERRFILY